MGITPDFIIKVKDKLLDEIDGPMLQHGIKELNNKKIVIPSRTEWKPDPNRLEIRFELFKRGSHKQGAIPGSGRDVFSSTEIPCRVSCPVALEALRTNPSCRASNFTRKPLKPLA